MAVFKLYAVHSGHEPGPLDGNARIMHRVIGHKGGFLMDQDMVYGVGEYFDSEGFGLAGKEGGDFRVAVLQQVQELRAEIGLLEGRIGNIPRRLLGLVSGELFDILSKVRSIGEGSPKSIVSLSEKLHSDDMFVGENDLAHWSDHHHERLCGVDEDAELIEDDEESFGRTLGVVVPWDQIRADWSGKDLINDPCKTDKWLKCSDFDEKNILGCEDTKLTKPMRHDDGIVTDVGLVGIQVDSFYHENPKWYDSPCALDSSASCFQLFFFAAPLLGDWDEAQSRNFIQLSHQYHESLMSSFFSFTLLWQASIVTGDNCTFFPHKSEASNVRKRKVNCNFSQDWMQ
ncbi:hypothetical protein V6N13_079766 [Hibiscus sabdariffa]